MKTMTKQEELTLMQNSHLNPLTTNIKNVRKPIVWSNTWDFKSNLHEISFNTTSFPPDVSPLISYKTVDLRPLKNVTIYKVTIKRN